MTRRATADVGTRPACRSCSGPASLPWAVVGIPRGEGPQHWLFDGLKTGAPIDPSHLAARLRRIGVPVRFGRSSALAALAYRIPALVLAELLGLSAKTTTRASADLKVDYAGYVARRTAPSELADG